MTDERIPMMYCTRWGDIGPRVVMVHGSAQGSKLGGDRHFSRQQHLADLGWQVIVPDRPGHGRTPSPGRPDDAELDGPLVARLLDDGDGEGAHLVGHSFGACVALAAAAQTPGAVRSLTLIEPAMAPLAIGKSVVLRFVLRMVRTLLFSFSDEARIKRFSKLVNIPQDLRGSSDPEEMRRLGRAIAKLRLPNKKTLARQLEVVRRAGIPLLVVSGDWSPAFQTICGVAARAGGGCSLAIASPHHFPQLVSDQFNETLAAFMRDSDAKRAARS